MKLTPSRAQLDLADMEARIATLVRAQPKQSVARQAANIVASSMASEDVVERAQSYGRWLTRKNYTDQSNKRLRAQGIAEIRTPAFVGGDDAKRLYERIARDAARDASGALRLSESLTNEVVRRLECMKNGGERGPVLHASVSMSEVTAKFSGNGKRVITGFASTDDVDLMGDIVVPRGMQTPKLPLPLLWQHDHSSPIGTIVRAEVRGNAVWIEAHLVEGVQRADEAWKLIQARACDAFSIGAKVLESEPLSTGGRRWTRWTMIETSVVSCPANPAARIARNVGGIPIKAGPARINGGYALRQPRGSNGGYPLRTRGTR